MTDQFMTQLGGFFELVTFDILLLGLLALLFVAALRAVWIYVDEGFPAVCKKGRKVRRIFTTANARKQPIISSNYIVSLILLVAACVGMFMNHLADELLEVIPTYSLVRSERLTACQPTWLPLQPKPLGTEDEIKCDVANKVLHSGPAAEKEDRRLTKNQSKAFFQHAYIQMLGSDRSGVTNMLRFEYLVVRFLRVLFALFLSLTIAAFFLMLARIARPRESQRAFAVALVCSAMTFVCLWLSGEQQHRYLKKLAYAYLSLAAGTDHHNLSLEPLCDFLPAGSPSQVPRGSSLTPRP